MMMFVLAAAAPGDLAATPRPAESQFVFEDKGWTGEAALSANSNTGNTDSSDVGAAAKFRFDGALWRHFGGIVFDYGESGGVETKNRLYVEYEADRHIRDRLFGYGRGAYEVDRFGGYDSRAVVGGGLGYQLLDRESGSWTVRGGPALRIDELEAVVDPETNAVTTPAKTQTEAAVSLGSNFVAAFSDDVTLTNLSDVTSSAETTTLFNSLAVTADLLGPLAMRASFDVTHDTQPPVGKKDTDTTTRVSLVYKFGD